MKLRFWTCVLDCIERCGCAPRCNGWRGRLWFWAFERYCAAEDWGPPLPPEDPGKELPF